MHTPLAVTEHELQQLLSDVAFTRNYGFRLSVIAEGACTLHVPFQVAFERPGGLVSGQVFMAAADVAMWLAIMTKLGKTDQSVTVELTTAFLNGAKQEDCHCTAKILKMGKRLIYGVAECVSGTGRLLTHHTITYVRPDP
jgi:acyl-coenzyme A thioesterase PaaI-like protein